MSSGPIVRSFPTVADGAIWDVAVGPHDRLTKVKLQRCPAGWEASFQLADPAVPDLCVVHRLVAPTMREAKAAVPRAISFLLGNPLEGLG